MPRSTVDLPRARRARDALDALLQNNPALAERTARWARGELPGPTVEDLMGRPKQITEGQVQVRLPGDLLARAEALVPVLTAAVPDLRAWGPVSRAAVIRVALLRGLDALEAEHGKPARRRGAKREDLTGTGSDHD